MKTFRFVRHEHVYDYLRLGWHIADPAPAHHGYYGVLLQWLCGCKLVEPLQ